MKLNMFEPAPVRGTMLRQTFACVCANLMSLSRGASNAWLTANFLALQRSDTPLPYGPLSLKEASLVISIYYVGSFSGNFMAPFIVRTFGSKRVILCVAFPQIALFLLIIFAQNPYYLYVTSIMGGWLSANLVNAMAMFVSDVSDDRMRGSLIACYDTAFNVGAALAYFIAKYFNLVDQAKVLLVFPVLFLVMFIGIPQTPQHLARKGDKEAANRANNFFKGTDLELNDQNKISNVSESTKLTLNDFTNRRARKAIFISFSLVFLYGLQGTSILSNYITEIFSSTNSNMSSLTASMIIALMLIMANSIYMNVVDRVGRRTLYICSGLATSAGLTSFGIYLYYLADNHAFDWMPVVCLSFVVLANCVGMYPIPWLLVVELMPRNIKHYGYSGCLFMMIANDFIFTGIYPLLKEHIGLLGWIVVFDVAVLCSAIYGYFVIPETRGKSHEQIMENLDK